MFEQADDRTECSNCGVIFSKYQKTPNFTVIENLDKKPSVRSLATVLRILAVLIIAGAVYFSSSSSLVINQPDTATTQPLQPPTQSAADELRKPDQPALSSAGTPPNSEFALRGRIIDSRKILLQGLMDEGVSWDGRLDTTDGQVGRQVVVIHAYSDGNALTPTHPDEKGEFSLTANASITHLSLAVSGGGLFFQANGPWSSNANVVIDLNDKIFVLDGDLKSMSGKPVQREMITAYDDEQRTMVTAYSDSRGHFRFWSNQPIAALETHADNLPLLQRGPWRENTSIMLARKQGGVFTVQGRISDSAGRPVPGIRISATFEDGSAKSALSDNSGLYAIKVDRKVVRLFGYSDLTEQAVTRQGSWSSDAKVDFTFDQSGIFNIKGRVIDHQGNPSAGIFVHAIYADGSKPPKTPRTNANGEYTLEAARPVASINVYLLPSGPEVDISGPWDRHANVDIRLPRK